MRRTLVVMAKAPIPGEVKTRLCPPLGGRQCAQLHECFVLDALEKAAAVPDAELVISYAPAGTLSFFREAAPDARGYLLQKGKDLGKRLWHCLERVCEPGTAVVVMGADSPTLPVRCLELAFDALASGRVDVVFGPAGDGGYYLIGMTFPYPELFEGVNWSTPEVLEKSIERTAELGLDWYLLPEWYDVDTPADLARLKVELLNLPAPNRIARHTREFLAQLSELR